MLFSWGSAVYGQLGYPVTDEMETEDPLDPVGDQDVEMQNDDRDTERGRRRTR